MAASDDGRHRFARFVSEAREELRRVIWPRPREVRTYAAVIALAVISTMMFVLVLDVIFGRLEVALFGR